MRSIRILLDQIVNYAGLFPPASLDMDAAVGSYAAYRRSKDAWALGRFIVPVARLEEFEAAAYPWLSQGAWRVSVLAGSDVGAAVETIARFNRRHAAGTGSTAAAIDTIELKATHIDDIAAGMRALPGWLTPYFEIPIDSDPRELVAALARQGARAKVRTGGVRQELFPPVVDLAWFIHTCATAQVPFKATAGLHHPVRSLRRLTYEQDSPSGMMHGFLNVFLAAAFLHAGMLPDQAPEILEEVAPDAFRFDGDGVTWRGRRLDDDSLARARRLAVAFGSCSFREPLDDLKTIGLL